jgi:hypothetical protein
MLSTGGSSKALRMVAFVLVGFPLAASGQHGTRYEKVITTGAGNPQWIEQGPASIFPKGDLSQSGGIESILVDPANRNRIFIGSVNGGIWQTANGTAANPTWQSHTDGAVSLSIGDLNFDPMDSSRNTIYAAIGRYSSFNDFLTDFSSVGGTLSGLLRSQDGGGSWTSVGSSTLNGLQIRNVFPTGTRNPGQVILVGTNQGVFRSTDGGNSFVAMRAGQGLPSGAMDVTNMAADPTSATTFYAASPAHGIYSTNDTGASWKNITGTIPNAGAGGLATASRIKLAVSAAATHPLYVAIVTDHISGLYRSIDKGASWTSLTIPSPQLDVTFNQFAFGADPQDANLIYAAGYQGVNNLQSGQVGSDGTTTWSALTGKVAGRDIGNYHPDSRDIVFDSAGDLLMSCDGGIYRLMSPRSPTTRAWLGLSGNLAITEDGYAVYDTLNAVSFSGHQDTGSAEQPFEEASAWAQTTGGDGTEQGVDNSLDDRTIRFYSNNGNLHDDMFRTVYGADSKVLEAKRQVRLASPGTPSVQGSGLLPKKGFGGFLTNKVTPSRMILFGGALYEGALKANGTGDSGDTITTVALPADAVTVIDNLHTAAVYGGWQGTTPNPGVLYVGFHVQEMVNGSLTDFNRLYFRPGDGAALTKLPYPDTSLVGLAVSPTDWHTIYALGLSKVYKSTDAGQTWKDITASLALTRVWSVDVIGQGSTAASDTIVVGGAAGVFASANGGSGAWSRLGANLPNVTVTDVHYYPAAARGGRPVGDVLIAGTIGRGSWVWQWNTWRTNLSTNGTFQVHSWKGAWGSDGPIVVGDFDANGKSDVIMWRDSTKSWTVNLSTGSGFNAQEWKGAWGSDGPIVVGDFDGNGKSDVMMWRDSTKSWTVNLSTGSGFNAQEWKGAWGSDGPIVVGDFNGDGKTDVMMWRDSTKSWTVNLSTGSGFNAQEWKGAWGSDGPIVVGDFDGNGKSDVMMWRDSTKSWTVNLSTGSGFNAQEWKGAWGSDGPIVSGDFNGDHKTDVMMWRK